MSSPVESSAARRRCRDDQYGPCMEFAGAGTPFNHFLNRRLGTSFAEGGDRYSATSAENYGIESQLRQKDQYVAIVKRFGREKS